MERIQIDINLSGIEVFIQNENASKDNSFRNKNELISAGILTCPNDESGAILRTDNGRAGHGIE